MAEAGPAASERKLVTILFADLAGSTELAERLDPERLNVLLEAYFGRMAAVIESWGGTVEKFIGDAVVAVFGVPVVREDDPERAIRAGLEMLTRLEELNDANAARHGVRLVLRIGIATGQVIAPAAAQAGQRLIAGDAANVAARLQAAAPPGSILVTERTARATRRAFVFGDATDVVLKGKSQPVRTMTVRGVAEGDPPIRMAPLTGRSAEIAAILGTSEAVVERNEPRCVLIVGPAGIGKSRLTLEAERRLLERHVGAQVLRGRCLALGRGVTYWPLMEMLREAAGIAHDDPAQEAAALLDAHIRAVLAVRGMAAEAIDEASAALAASVGLPVREELLTGLEPREVAERIAEAWTDYASALASRGPTVMVIEDLHWAGGAMIGLLDRLVSDARGPLLVLATARPDTELALPRAEARGRLVLVSVGSLTDDESRGLLAAVLEGEPPGELVRAVLDRAEGNPFFIEEILHHLVDEGLLRRLPTGWTTPGEAELSRLPDSIHAVLTARIDALPPATRRTLHHAAVVGRTFRLDALGALLGDDTLERLAVAEARGLVGRVENGEQGGPLEYAFRHALVRDVAYGMLPKAERARSHARYARWLEGDSGDRTDEIVEVLAFHFHAAVAGEDADLAWVDDTGEADDLRKAAFRCLTIAASAARGRFATDRAIELHTQALDLSGDDRERVIVLDEIGDDHEVAFQGDESHAARLAALEIAFREPLLRPLIPAIAAKAARFPFTSRGAFRHRPLPDDLDRLIDAALDHATAGADRAMLLSVKAHGRLYRLHLGTDDPLAMDDRLGMARAAVDLARRVGDPAAVSRTIRTLAQLLFAAGEYSASVEAVLSLRDVLPTVGSPIEEWPIRFEIARAILDNVGPFGEGLQESDQVWQLLRRMSAHDRLHGLYIMLHSHALTGRWAAIPDLLDQQLALYQQDPGNICPYIQAAPFIGARILAHRGDVAAAEDALASVPASAFAAGTPDAQRARALIALGRVGEGRDIAERILGTRTFWTTEQTPTEIIALIEADGWLPDDEALPALLRVARTTGQGLALLAPGADLAEGRAVARAGDVATAEVLIRRAVDGFSALGAPFETALATEALATTAATTEGRQQMLSEALAIFSELGARPHERRVEVALIAG